MKKSFVVIALGLTATALSAAAGDFDLSKLPPAAKKDGLTYDKDIRPVLEASCFRCHGGQRPKAGLNLTSLEGILKGSKDGKVIVPGKGQDSKLVIAVSRLDEESAMPPKMRGHGGPGGPGGPGGTGGPPGDAPKGPPNSAPDGKGPPPEGGPGRPGGPPGGMGPMPKPLTAEQVGLIRAWVDQGAK